MEHKADDLPMWIAQIRLEETWALMHGVTDERYRRELAARAQRLERILSPAL